MDINAVTSLAGAIVAIIGAIVVIWKGVIEGRKTLAQGKKDRADAFITYEEFVTRSATNNLEWAAQVEKLQDEIAEAKKTSAKAVAELQKVIDVMSREALLRDAKIEELERSRDDLQDWAERLVAQIEAKGDVPVKMHPRERR